MERITLVQPRHVYAPEEGDGYIHLSAPLITAGARMEASGYAEVRFIDENFGDEEQGEIEADLVGINLVGAPYIPRVIQMISKRIRAGAKVLLGGQIIDSLSDEEFEQLFCSVRSDVEVVNGNREIMFAAPEEEVSSIQMWEKISDEQMREYLSREFSFYLSQGCKYRCTFCQAKKNRPENYRNMDLMRDDLEYLVLKAKSFGLEKLLLYLSNLDIFQTPERIREFAQVVIELQEEYDFYIHFRGLAGVKSVIRMQEQDPQLLPLLAKAGLVSVGYGVDGNPAVWPKLKKHQNLGAEGNALERCVEAIRLTAQMGIIPEILMVVGTPADTRETLEAACQFTRDMIEKYGAVARPHVAKSILPGADEWEAAENSEIVTHLLANPERFKDLDYLALASDVTHDDFELRALVNEFAVKLAELMDGDPWAQLVLPDTFEMNVGKYDR